MLNDTLANALSKIGNAEKLGKNSVMIKPYYKVIKSVFTVMQEHKFIGEFKEIEDGRGGMLQLELIGKINKCGAVKPRYPVKMDKFEQFEKRYLPAKNFGIIIISTTEGIMTQDDARKKDKGGVLLAYCY